LKVLLLITGLNMGGAECQVINLADRLSIAGHDVLLISLNGNVIVRPNNPKVHIECIGMNKSIFGFIKAYRRVRVLIRNFNPDVVHSHMVHANIFARLLRLTTPMPRLISTAHNTNDGGFVRQIAYKLTDFLADISTNVSKEAVESFIQKKVVVPGRMIAVYNGIDTEQFHFAPQAKNKLCHELSISENSSILLAVGRLTEQKDFPNLLNAFTKVINVHHELQLVIVGVGDLLISLQNQAEILGISPNVHFLGLRRDIPSLMSASDIFVLSSAWEGFGLVVAEAMACERLVVATDCGGVREVIGNTGDLVPPGDSDQLAKAIINAVSLPSEERDIRGKAARNRIITYYSMDATVSRWISIYNGDFSEVVPQTRD